MSPARSFSGLERKPPTIGPTMLYVMITVIYYLAMAKPTKVIPVVKGSISGEQISDRIVLQMPR